MNIIEELAKRIETEPDIETIKKNTIEKLAKRTETETETETETTETETETTETETEEI